MSIALWRGAAGAAGKPLRLIASANTDTALLRPPSFSDPPSSRAAEEAAAAGAAKCPLPRFLVGPTLSNDDLHTSDWATPSAPASSTVAVAAAAAAACVRTGCHMPRHYLTSCRRLLHGDEVRSSMVSERKFSTAGDDPFSSSSLPSVDLISATALPSSSKINDFNVDIGNPKDFVAERERDMEHSKRDMSVPILQELYQDKVEAAIKLRGLLSPFILTGIDAIDLNQSYKDRLGAFPKYMTTRDLMVILSNMSEIHWSHYLDSLSNMKVLVVEDWSKSLGIASSPLFHDEGMIFPSPEGDTRLRFKGECDASVKGEFASISFLISHATQVYKAQVYHGIPCRKNDSGEAEAWAMFLLLKRLWELGLHVHIIEARTDNKLVYEVLTGIHEIKEGKYKEVFLLLRRMTSRFSFLVPMWMPREKLIFADGLLRAPLTKEDKLNNAFQLSKMREDWAPFLQGCPRFITRDHPSNLPIDLGKRGGPVKNTHECCYLQVEEDRKVDAIWHVSAALRPGRTIYVAFKETKLNLSLREELSKLFIDGVAECTVKSDYSLFSVRDSRMTSNKEPEKNLYVILDATISPQLFQCMDTFLVYILTQDEKKLMNLQNIPKFGPLSFVSFHYMATHPSVTAERKEKTQICSVSHAVSVLASASCVGLSRQSLFKFTLNQIGLYCSMLKTQDGENTKKVAVKEKFFHALIEMADATLQELQEEVDHDRIQVANSDDCSKKFSEEVAEAVAYLSTIMKGGVKDVVCNWRREVGTSKLKSQDDDGNKKKKEDN